MNELDQQAMEALARPADQQAIEFAMRWITWGEMRAVAERTVALIDASGADPGAKIALVGRNRPSAVAALLGLISRRSRIRMVYPFQSTAAIARDLQDIKPGAVIAAGEDFGDEIFSVLKEQGIAAIALEDMQATALPGHEHSRQPEESASGEPQIEILTSGTTGAPKPFPLSYELIARHYVGDTRHTQAGARDPEQQPPALLYFPLGNITGIYSTLPPLLRGQRVTLLERFTVAGWHDHLVRYRPAAGGLPPAGVQMVLDADLPREDFTSLKMIGTGAAPLDPSLQQAFEERYGVPILLAYGATEFGGPVASMTPELHAEWGRQKLGSVGRALPGAQLRVVDPDTGAPLPAGEQGVLEVISPRIGPDWIRTSDMAMVDEDGFLFLRGRADGAIMRGGFKLLPETIERALMLHPAVSAAAAVGIADHRLGQVPAVAVQLKPGIEAPTRAELESHLREHIPATHIPVVWRFVDELPRTPSLKVSQPALRQLLEEGRAG